MKTPATPENEAARLRSLRSLNVLDTAPEERFDRLTRLARRLFNVPIALVSLVDENRQWFKSAQGLTARETPRDISFCGHAILGHEVFVIPNALDDPRFADNPLVTAAPHIRFYAGCPLRDGAGHQLGTLCLIDRVPRTFEDEDVLALQDLAIMVERELAAIQLATTDELTGISNRRGFSVLAEKGLKLCQRNGQPASLLFIDLDNFKGINDAFGHTEGDKVLIAFSRMLESTFRDSDVFGRIGGDEFAALLTGSNIDVAQLSISRLQEALEAYNGSENRGYEIEFSVGIAPIDFTKPYTIEALLEHSDQQMYQHKKARR